MSAGQERARRLLAENEAEILKMFEHCPPFGNVGITFYFHEGDITRIEHSAAITRAARPKARP